MAAGTPQPMTISAVPRETVNGALLETAAQLSRMRADVLKMFQNLEALKGATARGRDQLRRATMGQIGAAPVDMDSLAGDVEVERCAGALEILRGLIFQLGDADDADPFIASIKPAPEAT
jgi:hypothetical protein